MPASKKEMQKRARVRWTLKEVLAISSQQKWFMAMNN
jgi:hypothetical protein